MASPIALTGAKTAYLVAGFVLLFLVWEFGPPMWGGFLLIIFTLYLAGKALASSS